MGTRFAWLMIALVVGCGGESKPPPPDAAADAAVDATDDSGDASAKGPSADDVFDPAQIRTFHVTVTDTDWTWLNDHAQEEQYVPAEVRWGDVVMPNVGIRYKGGVGNLYACFDENGTRICPKLSMKFKFSEYEPDQRFAGLKRINFHSMHWDPSNMRDVIAYGLYRAAGVPAPRAVHARLVVNGDDLGLFSMVEDIDGEFVQDHFRDRDGGRGNLYKEAWPESEDDAPYRAALQTNEGDDADVTRMVRFATALNGADEETFRDVIGAWTDLPTLVSYLAVDRLMDNWDGIVGWYCNEEVGCYNHNYFWYEQTDTDRMWLIPWDMDTTLQSPNPIRTFYNMPDWDAAPDDCAERAVILGLNGRPPACDHLTHLLATSLKDDYDARTEELLEGIAAPGAIEAQIDAVAVRIASEVANDPHGPDLATWQAAVANLRSGIAALRARVEP